MSIKDFVEMTIFICLIYLFPFMQKFNLPAKMLMRNGGKMNFGKNCQLTLWIPWNLKVKIFTENALSHTVSKINPLLHFMQNFKMDAKNGGKKIFGKNCQMILQIPWGE